MTLKKIKTKRLKPLFIKFYKIFENVQSREKLFKFRNKKWQALIRRLKKRNFMFRFYKRKLIRRRKLPRFDYLGNTIIPQVVYRRIPRFKKRYLHKIRLAKKISLFYGDLTKNYLRKIVKKNIWKKQKNKTLKIFKTGTRFLEFMEKRLESILYRSFFTSTIKQARNLISHGHITVNKQIIRQGSYLVDNNDIIEIINPQVKKLVKNNLKKSKCWPVKQNTLTINYKTLRIAYLIPPSDPLDLMAMMNPFSFPINLRKVLHYYRYN